MVRRVFLGSLLLLFLCLQAELWFSQAGISETLRLKSEVAKQEKANGILLARNQVLEADVQDLKSGKEAIEARARHELGMDKRGETFYQIVD